MKQEAMISLPAQVICDIFNFKLTHSPQFMFDKSEKWQYTDYILTILVICGI
jgi:hypothetical protein